MKKKLFFSLIVTLILVSVLLSLVNIKDVVPLWQLLSPKKLFFLWLVYFLYLWLINLRFARLMPSRQIGMLDLLAIIFIHNMFNRLLPFRSGELSYIYLLKKRQKLPVAEATASLMVARIFDYITVAVFFVTGTLILLPQLPTKIILISFVIGGLLLLVLGLLASLVVWGKRAITFLNWFFSKIGFGEVAFVRLLLAKGEEVVASLAAISGSRRYFTTFLRSVAIWSMMFFIHYEVLVSMGLGIDFLRVILGSTFAVFTNILPINGIAGLGTVETGWAIGYMLQGMTRQQAICSGFMVHIFLLLCCASYGIIGFLIIAINNYRQQKTT